MPTDNEIADTLPALSAGNVAVVTGAASGIGLAAAKRLASLGMKVVLADVPGDRLEAAADALRRDFLAIALLGWRQPEDRPARPP